MIIRLGSILGAPKAKGKLSKCGKITSQQKDLSKQRALADKRIRAHRTENMTELSARGPIVWVKGVRGKKNRLTPQRKEGRVKKGRDAPRGASRELVHWNSRENISL